jgi:hypothetical protein
MKSMTPVSVPGLCQNDQFLGLVRGQIGYSLASKHEVAVSPFVAASASCHSELTFPFSCWILDGMDANQTIAEIECLERIFAVPDTRPLSASDLAAANRRHDEMLAHSPWFKLWQRYGVCCRPESPVLRLGESEN